MQLDLPGLRECPPELAYPGPCGMCGADAAIYGVALRSLVVTLRHTVEGNAPRGEQLALALGPENDPPPWEPQNRAYLPLRYVVPDPAVPRPVRPTVGLCYEHTVSVVQLMRSWGDPPDGYDWVPDGLLSP